MPDVFFHTERLAVRPFTMADLDAFAALCADPQVMRYVGDGTTLPRAEVARWIEVCQQRYAERGFGTSAVVDKHTGSFLGYCGVIRAQGNDFWELIYVYTVAAWGHGYATEAGRSMLAYVFAHAALERIYATIDPANSASIAVAGKLGFHFERQVIDDDGTPVSYFVIDRDQHSG